MSREERRLFSWQATGTLSYDSHSDPDGGPAGHAESFDIQESDRGHGTHTAPFSVIHGWYWENLGTEEATIRLTTAGFYSTSQEFRHRAGGFYELTDIRGKALQDATK